MTNKEEKIIMPKSLTAENGAKGLLSGEFFEAYEVDYDGTIYQQQLTVSWTTIKDIYAMAVKHLGKVR